MSTQPKELKDRAVQERQHLHEMAEELRAKIGETREDLKLTTNARRHFGSAALLVTCFGLLAGYLIAGIFTRK